MVAIGIGIAICFGTGGVSVARIQLAGSTVAEDASVGDLVGTLSVVNGSGTYAFTLTDDAGGLFALDGSDDTRLEVADSLDYETATSHSITISADNGVDAAIVRSFTITVTDVDLSPGEPTLDLVAGSDTGSSSTDNITNDTTPDIDINLASPMLEGDVIKIYDSLVEIGSYTALLADVGNSTVSDFGLSALSEGSHSLTATHERDGEVSGHGAALVITVDTTAPTLSSPSGAEATDTTADLSVSTNEANGTIYWVVTDSSTGPSATQVKAGQDENGAAAEDAGSATVTGTGAQNFEADSLTTGGTHYAHFLHEDVAGNQSSVSTSAGWSQTGSGYTPVAVRFDGTNDWMERDADLDGAADANTGVCVFWINMKGGNGTDQRVLTTPSSQVLIRRETDNTIGFLLRTSGLGTVKSFRTTSTYTDATGWKIILAAWTGTSIQLYERDTDVLNSTTNSNLTIDYTNTDWGFGAQIGGTNKLNAELSDFRFWFGVTLDISVEANRRLFVDASGNPVDPATANASVGTPILQFSNAVASWHTNAGSGGGFTLTGALASGTPPP